MYTRQRTLSMSHVLSLALVATSLLGIQTAPSISAVSPAVVPAPDAAVQGVQHVLLLSIDGFHSVDLANYVKNNPNSTLAMLSTQGTVYNQAYSTKPSDSFPGLLALVTGATPKTTGVYYDDSYDRKLLPPLSFHMGDTPGTELVYNETIDKDLTKLDGGGGIDPNNLPRDPMTKQPIYPHSVLRVNTIFEVAKAAGKHTAWSDKHLAYELVNGPSGTGVDDLYTPEIASVAVLITPTESYDDLKVNAILNEIDGKDHTGTRTTSVPAIFGMNFQAVSVGQKQVGQGYVDAQGTPSAGLLEAMNHTDQSIGKMVAELKQQNLYNSTAIVITAKHGQSPVDPAKLRFTSNAKLTAGITDTVIAQLTTDDIGLFWLTDPRLAASTVLTLTANKTRATIQDIYSFATSSPAWLYDDPSKDSRTPDIVVQPVPGVIYTEPGKKIAEHGGFSEDDTHVALLVSVPGTLAQQISTPVQTTQVAPTILKLLGLNPNALQGVQAENTPVLPQPTGESPIVALPGYTVSLFAQGTSQYSHPDSIVVAEGHVYVAYQNVTAKDGTDGKSSTIVDYNEAGQVLHTYSIGGHCDGLRLDPATHLLWATANEDGNPALYTLNPTTGEIKPYQFPPTPHGGGYHDLAFVNGRAFIAASNPNLNTAGVNVFPAIDTLTLPTPQGALTPTVVLTPTLMGNATALDTTTHMTVTLNEVDPDSMTIDPQGDLVLVDQSGAEVVFLNKPGTAQQTVMRVPVGSQLDDTVWATTPHGRLFVVDGKLNAIYILQTHFMPNTVFTELPSDSGVAATVATLDLTTGILTPIAIGFGSPTGLLFVPGSTVYTPILYHR